MSLQRIAEVGSNPNKQKVQQILESIGIMDLDIPDFRELSIRDAIRRLKKMKSLHSIHSLDLQKIDSILLPLVELEYQNPFEAGPYDINIVKPLKPLDNRLLPDLNEYLLFTGVSDLLEVKYLSTAKENWNWDEHAKGRRVFSSDDILSCSEA